MALPRSGGGFQVTEGNVKEAVLRRRNVTNLAGTSALITAAMLAAGMIVTPTAVNATFTLDSGANIDKQVPNAVPNHEFDAFLINSGNNSSLLAMGTGLTFINGAGAMSVGVGVTAHLRFVKTGVGTWNVYRL